MIDRLPAWSARRGVALTVATVGLVTLSCADIEPVGTDSGDSPDGAAPGDVESGAPMDGDVYARDAVVEDASETADSASQQRDAPPNDTEGMDSRSKLDTGGGTSGPGACCSREGCIMVDAGSECGSPTFISGAQCTNVRCGTPDT